LDFYFDLNAEDKCLSCKNMLIHWWY